MVIFYKEASLNEFVTEELLVTSSALPSLPTPAAGGFGQPAEGVTRIGDRTGRV